MRNYNNYYFNNYMNNYIFYHNNKTKNTINRPKSKLMDTLYQNFNQQLKFNRQVYLELYPKLNEQLYWQLDCLLDRQLKNEFKKQ